MPATIDLDAALRELADVLERHSIEFVSCGCCGGVGVSIGGRSIELENDDHEITAATVREQMEDEPDGD